jgi:5-methylcytosine-specific restriction endonuclease McrA
MSTKGKHWNFSQKTKNKISESHKKLYINGYINPFKGRKHTEETKRKIGLKSIGRQTTLGKKWHWIEEIKERMKNNGRNKKISEAKKGKKRLPFSEEWKRKMSESHRGKKSYERTEKIREKTSNSLKGKLIKNKNPNWKGGISKELYGFDWTNLLKHSIRTRDCFVCQICKENGWIIHHINYNKKNNNPDNLITLCRSCHSKTNGNRNYWTNYFRNK